MPESNPPQPAAAVPARPSEYLDPRAVAARYHVSGRTLERWRASGDGPAFVRVGPRRVLYRLSDCEGWAADRTYAHRAAEIARRSAGG